MKPAESFIGQPIRSLQTMLRVISTIDSGIPDVIPDGIYGQETMAAVFAFQRKNGIPMTGVVDQVTWEAIVSAYETALIETVQAEPIQIIMDPGEVFRRGDASPYLYLVQSMLAFLSQLHPTIEKPSPNGRLDSTTEKALAGFQILASLPPSGELDKQTWRYLVNQFTLNANRSDQQGKS